jgi:hypothetical protein
MLLTALGARVEPDLSPLSLHLSDGDLRDMKARSTTPGRRFCLDLDGGLRRHFYTALPLSVEGLRARRRPLSGQQPGGATPRAEDQERRKQKHSVHRPTLHAIPDLENVTSGVPHRSWLVSPA